MHMLTILREHGQSVRSPTGRLHRYLARECNCSGNKGRGVERIRTIFGRFGALAGLIRNKQGWLGAGIAISDPPNLPVQRSGRSKKTLPPTTQTKNQGKEPGSENKRKGEVEATAD